MLSRYTVFLVACALPFLFTSLLAPQTANQLDFWLMWLLAMAVVGLPILFAEFALSARSGLSVWQGMQKLTRDADAKIIWRVFAGLSVLVGLFAAVSTTTRIATGVDAYLPQINLGVPTAALSAGLMVVALILSLLKSRLLPVGLVFILLGALISLFDGGASSTIATPVVTHVSLKEWGQAVTLALLSVGIGTGLYWFSGLSASVAVYEHKKSLSGFILPIWLTQIIFGGLALLASAAFITPLSFAVSSLGMLLFAGFLLHYVASQLIARFGLMMGAGLTIVLSLILSLIPIKAVVIILTIISLSAVTVLSIFSGFIMKISHLRKTLNFKTEGRYNIWRVCVRILVPLALAAALVGLVLSWF